MTEIINNVNQKSPVPTCAYDVPLGTFFISALHKNGEKRIFLKTCNGCFMIDSPDRGQDGGEFPGNFTLIDYQKISKITFE